MQHIMNVYMKQLFKGTVHKHHGSSLRGYCDGTAQLSPYSTAGKGQPGQDSPDKRKGQDGHNMIKQIGEFMPGQQRQIVAGPAVAVAGPARAGWRNR
jgi:hypothetical protein